MIICIQAAFIHTKAYANTSILHMCVQAALMKASAEIAHMKHVFVNMNSQEKAIMESNCTDDNICLCFVLKL